MKQYIETVDIGTRPTDSKQQVYRTNDSPVKHPRTVGLEQLQEKLPGHNAQPESTSLGDGLQKKQAHRSSHRSTSRIDKTRNNHSARLQQLSNKFCTTRVRAKGPEQETR